MADHLIPHCPQCKNLVKHDDEQCPRCDKLGERPMDGWPTMAAHALTNVTVPKPRLFVTPDRDLVLTPKTLGPMVIVEVDNDKLTGTLTIADRRYTFNIRFPDHVQELELTPTKRAPVN